MDPGAERDSPVARPAGRPTGLSASPRALRHEILDRLRRDGPTSPDQLAQTIGASRTGVLQQLRALEEANFVSRQTVRHGVGRPRHLYDVTPEAQELFPSNYDGLAAGLLAAIGLLPYIHEFDPDESVVASPIPWIAFIGPLLAVTVVPLAKQAISPEAGDAFGAILIGLGLLNVVWGSVASWRTEDDASAWRYSFMADWGLALCGFGLMIADGQAAALILLLNIVLGRLPLYLWSRQALREKKPGDRPIKLLVAALLAGSAPFAGFAARILLLRGATQMYWPLALVLAVTMLFWLPASLRLGRSLGMPRGRQLIGVAIVLAVNVLLGLYPQPLLKLAGL